MPVLALGTACVIVLLLAVVLWLALFGGLPGGKGTGFTIEHIRDVLLNATSYRIVLNTLLFSFVSLVVALLFGLPAAWMVERTDLPGKTFLLTMMTIGLLIPGFAEAMGWMLLLHPRIGLINVALTDFLGLTDAPFNIGTIFGMGWVQGLNLAPVVFVMTATVFRAMDPSLEEAAQISGAKPVSVLRRITLAVSWPGIVAAIIYVFTIGFGAFDVPAILGWGNRVFTFSTYIVLLVVPESGAPRYGSAAALSSFAIVLAAGLSWWYGTIQAKARRYQVVTGRAYRPRMVPLKRWKAPFWIFLGFYLLISKALPIIALIWASVLPFFQLPSMRALNSISATHYENLPWAWVWTALTNTGTLMILTPTIAVVLSVAFSWVVLRTKYPGRPILDFVAFLPHAVPHIVLGLSALLVVLFVIEPTVSVYGTIWPLLVVFVLARLSYGTRMTNSAIIQIHQELEESARVAGARTDGVLRHVILPLIWPSLIYAWLWMALLTYRELTLAVLLTSRDNVTVPVLIWNLWSGGGVGPPSALAVVMMGLFIPLVSLYWILGRNRVEPVE